LPTLLRFQKKKTISEPAQAPEQKVQAVTSEETSDQKAPPEQTPAKFENDVSRLVRTPGISIKNSLKGSAAKESPEADKSAEPGLPEQEVDEEKISADPDTIIRAWNDYAASIKKLKPRIHSTLVSNKPAIRSDGVVMVLLNSEAQRDNFLKNVKSDLVAYIKEKTGLPAVEILTEVTEKTENGKRIYTEQDKLEYLVQKNPELGNLRSRFNLDFDD